MFKWLKRPARKKRDVTRDLMTLRIVESLAKIERIEHRTSTTNSVVALRMDRLIDSVNGIRAIMLEQNKEAEEDRLGPLVYEITVEDLARLSGRDRAAIAHTGIRCHNDICATALDGWCQDGAITRIMEWKRSCVMRITEAQIDKAVKAIPNAADRADSEAIEAQRGGN